LNSLTIAVSASKTYNWYWQMAKTECNVYSLFCLLIDNETKLFTNRHNLLVKRSRSHSPLLEEQSHEPCRGLWYVYASLQIHSIRETDSGK
jgi:hypothetical protein